MTARDNLYVPVLLWLVLWMKMWWSTQCNCIQTVSVTCQQSLQIAAFLFTVCHVVIVVQDWFTDLNLYRYIPIYLLNTLLRFTGEKETFTRKPPPPTGRLQASSSMWGGQLSSAFYLSSVMLYLQLVLGQKLQAKTLLEYFSRNVQEMEVRVCWFFIPCNDYTEYWVVCVMSSQDVRHTDICTEAQDKVRDWLLYYSTCLLWNTVVLPIVCGF